MRGRGRPPAARRCGHWRYDQHGTARYTDQVSGHAAEPRGLESAMPARADDDQLGALVIGEVGKAVGDKAEGHTALRAAEPLLVEDTPDESFTAGAQCVEWEARQLVGRRTETGGAGLRIHDVGDDQAETQLVGHPRCNTQRNTSTV